MTLPPELVAPPFDAADAPCVTRTARIRHSGWAPRLVRPDDWFNDNPTVQEAIIGLCHQCPVRQPCLAWANRHEDNSLRFGIYGGMTAEQRAHKPPKRKQKKPKPDPAVLRAYRAERHPSNECRNCAVCGTLFYRRRGETPSMWRTRKFCGRPCAARQGRASRYGRSLRP